MKGILWYVPYEHKDYGMHNWFDFKSALTEFERDGAVFTLYRLQGIYIDLRVYVI